MLYFLLKIESWISNAFIKEKDKGYTELWKGEKEL